MLARIAALLRQAENTDNPHEAEAFMAAAQRLATTTSIDLAVARAHSATRTAAQEPVQRTVTIGEAGTRGLRTFVQLFVLIARANDVKCDIASNSTFVYAYGFTEDIDATHALYASVVVQMVKSSDAYISTGAHRPTPTITAPPADTNVIAFAFLRASRVARNFNVGVRMRSSAAVWSR